MMCFDIICNSSKHCVNSKFMVMRYSNPNTPVLLLPMILTNDRQQVPWHSSDTFEALYR